MGVSGKALQLHAVYKFTTSHVRLCISTTSHVHCIWVCIEIEGSYDKIIITIVTSYTGENVTRLLPLALLLVLCTRKNTDGNKLVVFSNIHVALYYGDTWLYRIIYTQLHFLRSQTVWIASCVVDHVSLVRAFAINQTAEINKARTLLACSTKVLPRRLLQLLK